MVNHFPHSPVQIVEIRVMRLPRMTTRRWMVAVAVVALSLGGSLYTVRLKRKRDRCLARAAWHSTMEADALRSLARVAGLFARPEPVPAPKTDDELAWAIDRVLGLPIRGWGPSEEDHGLREEQEAKEHAMAASRSRVVAEFRRRESVRLRKQVDYHAVLARKYQGAASRPWLAVPPDPPEPR
jgi:hypothetical protein